MPTQYSHQTEVETSTETPPSSRSCKRVSYFLNTSSSRIKSTHHTKAHPATASIAVQVPMTAQYINHFSTCWFPSVDDSGRDSAL